MSNADACQFAEELWDNPNAVCDDDGGGSGGGGKYA